jgi:coenzyme F420-reducing hydrogenase delta subunit
VGVEPERFQASWISASEAEKFVQVVTDVTEKVRAIGPNQLFNGK